MKFYCVCKKNASVARRSFQLLADACEELGVSFIHIVPEQYDFSEPSPLEPGDAVYRMASGALAKATEGHLLRSDSKTFFKDIRRAHQDYDEVFFHALKDIPSPKTIAALSINYSLLKKYVSYLGGFPVVLKILGKQMGAGVLKVDSLDALSSVARLATADGKNRVVLKEFIPTTYSIRAIVVGDKIAGSITYKSRRGDFRTNVEKNPLMEKHTLSERQASVAIHAVKALDLKFGGVDLLVNNAGEVFVAEVNFPCNFSDVQDTTGDKIATAMIQYLIDMQKTPTPHSNITP